MQDDLLRGVQACAYMLYTCTRKGGEEKEEEEQQQRSRVVSDIKTDRRSQETITVNG